MTNGGEPKIRPMRASRDVSRPRTYIENTGFLEELLLEGVTMEHFYQLEAAGHYGLKINKTEKKWRIEMTDPKNPYLLLHKFYLDMGTGRIYLDGFYYSCVRWSAQNILALKQRMNEEILRLAIDTTRQTTHQNADEVTKEGK